MLSAGNCESPSAGSIARKNRHDRIVGGAVEVAG
ncbi:hypothetical protein Z029_13300 [Mycobacterium tuberculosis INS_SEN]|nr:hypothetical protein Z030_13330 [Mycobacterium tuberculosis INS_XDR]EUA99363.1 hypothetical protein Z028_13340 [Mycobacterium tuberculosis INS_MDR]EUB03770.1 hypothetical protein Z029_13300 [Mycobacterium tuberculosis INS_SEN]